MEFARELRVAARSLRRDRLVTCVAVLALALGIAGSNTMFTLANAAVLRGLPMADSNRVLFVSVRDRQDRPAGLSYQEFTDLTASSSTFDALAAYSTAPPMTIGDPGKAADRVTGTYLSARGFTVLRDTPILGRTFTASDDKPGAPLVAILNAALWAQRYGSDPAIIDRVIQINGTPAVVIGVMREQQRFPLRTDVWLPISAMPGMLQAPRDGRTLSVIGRLAAGTTITGARAALEATARNWRSAFPDTERDIRLSAVPINEQFLGRITDRVWLGVLAVGFAVLLIACANVANLLLMRGVRRGREIGIRSSLGATRGRIISQLLIEAGLIAGAAGALGLTLSVLALHAFNATVPGGTLPYWYDMSIDGHVITMLITTCVASVFIVGLAPALHLSRASIVAALMDGGGTIAGSAATHRWTASFLVIQFAIALSLTAAVGESIRAARAMLEHAFRVDPAPLLTMQVALPQNPYNSDERRVGLYQQLQDQLGTIPGVSSVSIATAPPGDGGAFERAHVAERADPSGAAARPVVTVHVSDSYFRSIGVPLVSGEAFSDVDGSAGHEVAIVNQRFVEVFFRGEDAIGTLVRLQPQRGPESPWLRIVGIAPTVRQRFGPVLPDPVVYVPLRSAPPPVATILVRGTGSRDSIVAAARERVRQIDPNLPLFRIMPLERAFEMQRWNTRMSSRLLEGIGLVALLLAVVGVYSVTAYAVGQRWKEFGIRTALGASPRALAALVFRGLARPLAPGLILGLLLTVGLDRVLSDPEGPQRLTDMPVIGPVVALMVVIALIAAYLPAHRAAHVDPVPSMRVE